MLDPENLPRLRELIQERTREDSRLLDQLRDEIRPLKSASRRIAPRTTTSMSLVATDGGNNSIAFDPFMFQLVRVVDSYGKELCLDAVTPTTDVKRLSDRQFEERTALGFMMEQLGISKLYHLSSMIPDPAEQQRATTVKPSWVLVYRDLCEWAVLFDTIMRFEFATDTLVVRDGLLRSKLFSGDLFVQMMGQLQRAIEDKAKRHRRKVYLVGFAKHSKVLTRYQLAMAIEGIMHDSYPQFVAVPREIESKAYIWPEYARGEPDPAGGEAPKYVAGWMFFAKFGNRSRDPIWAVDILNAQAEDASTVFGYLLADALDGFPVPHYPRCLQQAHEKAALVGFDMDVLQAEIFRAVRGTLDGDKRQVLDAFRLVRDPSKLRYE